MFGDAGARRVRALRGGAVRRQEPVDQPRHPARPHHAQGDRQRPRPVDGRDRSRGAPRRPSWPTSTSRSARAATPGCSAAMAAVLVDEGLARPGLAGRPRRPGSTTVAGRAAATCRSPSTARSAASTRTLVRAATRRHRGGVERGRVRGPRRADEPPLDARQLPREAGLAAHRQPRPARAAQYSPTSARPACVRTSRKRARPRARRRVTPVRRRAGHRRADPVQRDRRRDPHRPPEAVPGDDRRVGQPGPLGRRQPADARGDRAPRRQRVHRRVHDRDGPAVPTTCCRRRPSSRSSRRRSSTSSSRATCSTSAARCVEPPDGPAARAGDPRPARARPPGCSTDADLAPLRAAAERGRAEFAAALRRGDRRPTRASARSRRSCCTARSAPTLPDGAAAAAALWPLAQRCALAQPRRRRAAPASATGPTPATGCSTPSSTARRASCSPTTTGTATWRRIKTADGLVHLAIPELLAELAALADEAPPGDDPEWPFLLSAGERRSFTANTIFRDPAWRKRDPDGALRVSPADAATARPRRRRPRPR